MQLLGYLRLIIKYKRRWCASFRNWREVRVVCDDVCVSRKYRKMFYAVIEDCDITLCEITIRV